MNTRQTHRSGRLTLLVADQERTDMVAAARLEGMSLSAWLRRVGTIAARRTLRKVVSR